MKLRKFFMVALLLVVATTARAGHVPESASSLIFPLYDASPGAGTVLCITNINTDNTYCPNSDYRAGDVLVHYVYIDGDDWTEFDRFELLTPGDTLCVLADEHNPEANRGFVVATAKNPETLDLIDFDFLIGSSIVVQSELNMLWRYIAYGHEASATDANGCTFSDPDAGGDGDGVPDYDGTEYRSFPTNNYIVSFFEEGGPIGFSNQLTIMSTSGSSYINEVDFLFYNNIEQKFSRSLEFTCWFSGALSEISSIASNLGGDEDELGHNTQTGWVHFTGRRIVDLVGNPVKMSDNTTNAVPAMRAVFMQAIVGTDFAMGGNIHGDDDRTDGMEIEPGGDRDPQTFSNQ